MLGAAEPFRPRRRERFALFGLGALLAVVAYCVAFYAVGPAEYHVGRANELAATVSAYDRTGVLLVKDAGTGYGYIDVGTDSDIVPAALDDDPGSYLLTSVFSRITGVGDSMRAVTYVQALAVALPMLWLPWTLAALFRRTRAGLAAIALPLVVPLLKGSPRGLLGTEYGLDVPGALPVYALYGLGSSALFVVLSLFLLFATRRRDWRWLVGGVVVFGVLAALCGLMRSWSGIGVVLGVAVFVALHARGWRRLLVGAAAAVVGVAVLLGTQAGVRTALDAQRSSITGVDVGALPSSHTTWHPLYLGLGYTDELGQQPSELGVLWADRFGWEKAWAVDPDVVIASPEYDAIMRDLYLEQVRAHPGTVAVMYVEKAVDTVRQNVWVLGAVLAGVVLLWRRPTAGPVLRRATLLLLPALLYGFTPPTLVVPMRYYFMELSAASGLLLAVVVGGVAAATVRRTPAEDGGAAAGGPESEPAPRAGAAPERGMAEPAVEEVEPRGAFPSRG
jgi:hypothetical protein